MSYEEIKNDIVTNLNALRAKVSERERRMNVEQRTDYILKSDFKRENIMGLITDKYCFQDNIKMIYEIATNKELTDKQKLQEIIGLSE